MKKGIARRSLLVLASLGLSMSARAVSIDWVTVGQPGNACDTRTFDCFGTVDYVYRIAKYEVTNAQYAEFLNAKAASDPLELYTPWGIARSGSSGSFTYSAVAGQENGPVAGVSYFDALRFANWMHNGQGSGDTETGAYTLLGGTPIPSNLLVERNPGATVFVPTHDEWHKAAFHDPATGAYHLYPTGTDTQVVCSAPTATSNRANCGGAAGGLTDVGSYPGSPSPHGTFDQGGNMLEWTDFIVFLEMRPTVGGTSGSAPDRLRSTILEYDDPWLDLGGFRLAAIDDGGGGTGCTTHVECNDGQFCNGIEACLDGTCAAGTPIDCDDGVGCTSDACNDVADVCVHSPNDAACSNGMFCDGTEVCDADLDCQDGADPCQGASCDETLDACVSAGPELWISFLSSTAVPGVGTVQDEDIVVGDMGTGTWSLRFDGSDVGLANLAIDGLAVLPSGDLLLSFATNTNLPGLIGGPSGNLVYDADIVRFSPETLGSTTSGTFTFHFDGSDVGLTTSTEDVDAIALAQDGKLIISTLSNVSANGASGTKEDLLVFHATSLGAVTSGTFSVLFDGSDVGLSSATENVDAVTRTQAGQLLWSTSGLFSVPGVSGADEDLVRFTPLQLGATTSGSHSLFLDLSTVGIPTSANVNAFDLVE